MTLNYSKSKHFSGHSRPCADCNQRLPTHPEKKNRFTGLPELMDPTHEGLLHWRVCPKKHSKEEIEKIVKEFYVNRVHWKLDNGFTPTITDYAKAGMEPPLEDQDESEIVEDDDPHPEDDRDGGEFESAANLPNKRKPGQNFEQYLMQTIDENWKIIHNHNERMAKILENLSVKIAEQNSLLRSISRFVGIADT